MRSNLFAPENQEQESAQPGLRLQNSKMLKIELDGEALARQGSMVAYQGDVRFEAKGSGSLGNFVKQKLTSEGVPLMRISGRGDVFLADAVIVQPSEEPPLSAIAGTGGGDQTGVGGVAGVLGGFLR
ncbi:MAG TPA: AIM24 family protein [Actinomycetospora sp.]|uniref:AIM24 family protein n=1 Tax=Actinomycetospora sp. TaxID=1872135 RepID=UPI002F3E7CE6